MTSRSKVDINYRILDVIDKSELAERIKLDEVAKLYGPEPGFIASGPEPGLVAKPMLPNTVDEDDDKPLSSLIKSTKPEQSTAPKQMSVKALRPSSLHSKKQSDAEHRLAHTPSRPGCKPCEAKRRTSPHNGEYDCSNLTQFCQVVAADIKVLRPAEFEDSSMAANTEKDVLVLRDLFSGYYAAIGLSSHTAQELSYAMKTYFGTPGRLIADCEFEPVAKMMGSAMRPHVSHDHVLNSLAENAVNTVTSSAKALMFQSGMPFCFSAFAMQAAAHGLSTTLKNEKGQTAWDIRFGDLSEPYPLAFGQGARVVLPNELRREREPLAATSIAVAMLAPIVDERGSILWSYIDITKVQDSSALASVSTTRQSDIILPDEVVFPVKVASTVTPTESSSKEVTLQSLQASVDHTGQPLIANVNSWPCRANTQRPQTISPALWRNATPAARLQARADVEEGYRKLLEAAKAASGGTPAAPPPSSSSSSSSSGLAASELPHFQGGNTTKTHVDATMKTPTSTKTPTPLTTDAMSTTYVKTTDMMSATNVKMTDATSTTDASKTPLTTTSTDDTSLLMRMSWRNMSAPDKARKLAFVNNEWKSHILEQSSPSSLKEEESSGGGADDKPSALNVPSSLTLSFPSSSSRQKI